MQARNCINHAIIYKRSKYYSLHSKSTIYPLCGLIATHPSDLASDSPTGSSWTLMLLGKRRRSSSTDFSKQRDGKRAHNTGGGGAEGSDIAC